MDGTLDPLERAAMDEHLAACPNCGGLLRSVRQTVDRLHSLEPAQPGPWLAAHIVSRTTPSAPQRKARLGWFDFAFHSPRFLLGALAVLITFSVVFGALGGAAPLSAADANPVTIYRQLDRFAHLAYARGVKFISDLRVVYEIQARFQQPASDPASSLQKQGPPPVEQNFDGRQEKRFGLERSLRLRRPA
jgi:anti-sigma factor RsiW